MILRCSCKHAFQDARYGKGKRAHNEKSNHDWRCTVCANVKQRAVK